MNLVPVVSIADDEEIARRVLRDELAEMSGVVVVSKADNGEAALAEIAVKAAGPASSSL